MIIIYFITVLLILLGIVFKRSKKLYYIQLFWLWIIMALNNGGPDWIIHEQIFNSNINFMFDISKTINGGVLYGLICNVFYKFNLDFFSVNLFISTISILVIHRLISKNTKNRCTVISLFYIYPLVESIIQKRNFAASICILIGMKYLFENTKNGLLKYLIWCFIAAQFHMVAYVYILFAIFYKFDINKLEKVIPIVVIIGCVAIPIIPKIAMIFFPESKVQLYFYEYKVGLFNSICWGALHIAFVILAKKIYKISSLDCDDMQKKFAENVYKINIISLIFLPLYYYEPTFIRIYRNLLILNYIIFANILPKNTIVKKYTFEIILLHVMIVLFAFFIVYIITGEGFDFLIKPLFYNNIFFNYFIGG